MLTTPLYRKDYVGELLHKAGEKILVKPRSVFYRPNNRGRAIVLGNGTSRLHPQIQLMLRTNKNKPMPHYKITYACNGAVWDTDADYYVVTNRVLMSAVDRKLWPQVFLPWDMFLDYDETHCIPYLGGMDAGSYATFLACFDGHDEIMLMGFDAYPGEPVENCYEGRISYPMDKEQDSTKWHDTMANIMRTFRDVKFYRIGGGTTPMQWRDINNFREVNPNEAVSLGDF